MAADVGQILDCEGVEKVIGVSHDLIIAGVIQYSFFYSKYISLDRSSCTDGRYPPVAHARQDGNRHLRQSSQNGAMENYH
uniref:Uncharacterized protein n=1 Tax=Fusarium oxysporum (strain Fo5176) TaxID=660025 RepID=A0A0D2XL39_FUSOF